MLIELTHHGQPVFSRVRYPKLAKRDAQQLHKGKVRIENAGRSNVGIETARQSLQQRRLPRSRLAGNDNEALSCVNAITQRRECFFVARIDEKEPRIRSDVERRFCKTKMFVIHKSLEGNAAAESRKLLLLFILECSAQVSIARRSLAPAIAQRQGNGSKNASSLCT